jgi:predicted PurR-regulated permease PerM
MLMRKRAEIDSRQPSPFTTRTTFRTTWMNRLIVSLVILIWILLGLIFFWLIGHVIGAVASLTLAILLAYTLYPAVKFLQRFLPRALAILLVYVVGFGALCVLSYILVATAVTQLVALTQSLQASLASPGSTSQDPLGELFNRLGISPAFVHTIGNQLVGSLEGLINAVVPLVTSTVVLITNVILVIAISVYVLLDGARAVNWLRSQTPIPQRGRINFLVDTLDRVFGHYIRGMLVLASIIATITAVTMAILGVPYAMFIFVLTFVLEFIPTIGIILTGLVCVLLAMTQSWTTTVLTLIAIIIIEVLEGDVLFPRIMGKSVGLHPITSLVALIAFSELFGLAGALFASPVAGVIQVLLVAFWMSWRDSHPAQFETEDAAQHEEKGEEIVPPVSAQSGGNEGD